MRRHTDRSRHSIGYAIEDGPKAWQFEWAHAADDGQVLDAAYGFVPSDGEQVFHKALHARVVVGAVVEDDQRTWDQPPLEV